VSDLSEKPPLQVLIDLLLLNLRYKNAVLNEHAAVVLSRMTGEPIRQLVREALRPGNGVPYRLRLLDVIERVGWVPTTADYMDLSVLAASKNPKLREAAGRCLVRCPAAGP
jgi:hypothetical protein